ncbi:MAG: hypothetical protein FWD32_02520 [Firmicutes bacterium]|nr:hypothetical protein [Bacillota bacterium]
MEVKVDTRLYGNDGKMDGRFTDYILQNIASKYNIMRNVENQLPPTHQRAADEKWYKNIFVNDKSKVFFWEKYEDYKKHSGIEDDRVFSREISNLYKNYMYQFARLTISPTESKMAIVHFNSGRVVSSASPEGKTYRILRDLLFDRDIHPNNDKWERALGLVNHSAAEIEPIDEIRKIDSPDKLVSHLLNKGKCDESKVKLPPSLRASLLMAFGIRCQSLETGKEIDSLSSQQERQTFINRVEILLEKQNGPRKLATENVYTGLKKVA